ncbi:MAG: serine acetyltransferase [Verrucomicrobiota bacterium]
MSLSETIRADWKANEQNWKGRFVTLAFRLAHWLRTTSRLTCILGLPYLVAYRLGVEWVLGIEIPPLTEIGPGLIVNHGQGIVINNQVKIGPDCRLRHNVTIGNRSSKAPDKVPVLGAGVEIGCGAVIIGGIQVGDRAEIGANAVVIEDVPAGGVVLGNPGKLIGVRGEDGKIVKVEDGEKSSA